MAGALRKTMVYLGFAEEDDERYDDLDTSEDRYDLEEDRGAAVTPLRRTPVAHVVREPAATLNRITTIHPRTYNEAKTIGEAFRDGVPVIMNLTDMEDADAKRLVDFAAGLIFGLHGSIERVTSKVFLLSPENVAISGDGSVAQADPEAAPFSQ